MVKQNLSSSKSLNWEQVDETTFRAKIPGGWLVKYRDFELNDSYGPFKDGISYYGGLTFVPDKNHEWEV